MIFPVRFLGRYLAAVVATAASAPSSIDAQKVSVLIGIVGDTSRKPLAGAEVLALRARIKMTTDQRGIFIFSLLPGEEVFMVRRVGFQPQSFEATMVAGDTLKVGVVLGSAPVVLPDVTVEAEGATYRGKLSEFGRRLANLAVPRSSFLTRKDIEAHSTTQVVNLLVESGMKLRPGGRGRTTATCSHGQTRGLPKVGWYLDGVKMGDDFDVGTLSVTDLEAIEVYRSAAERPSQYNATGYDCVVLFWLRER